MPETGWPYPLSRVEDPRGLSQAAVQAAELLGLYGAELARILGLRCDDIACLTNGRCLLQADTDAWQRARDWVWLYDLLHQHLDGDGVAMVHWLRVGHPGLHESPHRLLVDAGEMGTVIDWLHQAASLNPGSDRG